MYIKKSIHNKWQRGLSLIEAAMVLALSAVVVAGVMAYYQSASTNEKTERTITEIMAIISAVNSTYSSAPDFSGVSSSTIAKSGTLPASFVRKVSDDKWEITAPFGDGIFIDAGSTIESLNSSQYYHIDVLAPRDVCANLVRLDLGSSLVAVSIGGNEFIGKIPSIEDAQKYCLSSMAYDDDKHAAISFTLH